MSRSAWKGPFSKSCILKQKTSYKIWSRSSVIPFSLIGSSTLVHDGKQFKKLFINREKVGFKFGEFCFTRKSTKKTKKK